MLKKYKKLIIVAAIVVAVLLIALAVLLIGKNAGWFGGETPDNPDNPSTDEPKHVAFSVDVEEFKALYIHNSYGDMEIYSVGLYDYKVRDLKYAVDDDSIISLVVWATEVTCSSIVAENVENFAQYGLDSEDIYFIVEDTDGNKTKLIVGDAAPAAHGVYLRVEGENKVYLADEYYDDMRLLRPAAFLAYDIVPKLETDSASEEYDIDRLSSIRINSESTGREDIIMEYVDAEDYTGTDSSYYQYVMTKPATGITVNAEYFEAYVYQALTGITATSAVTIAPTAQELEEYKLADPWGTLELVIDGIRYTLTVGRVVYDSYCYVMMGEAVFFVPSSYFVCLDATVASLQSRFMFIDTITNFSNINVSYGGNTYSFKQSGTMFDEDDPWSVTMSVSGNKPVQTNADEFKKLYTLMLSMFIAGTTTSEDVLGDEMLKITYKYANSSEEVTLTYYQLDYRRCAIKFNNDDTVYYTMRKYVDKFTQGLSDYISGNTINLYS